MGSESFTIFFIVYTSLLLPFVASFGQSEYITKCSISESISYQNELTFICGNTDNTSDIFLSNEISCSNRNYPLNSYPGNQHYRTFKKINFQNCHFYQIDSNYLKNFTSLEKFDVSSVGLQTTSFKKIDPLQSLTWFSASHNQLTNISSDVFTTMRNLETLDVSYNAITHLNSTDFSGLTNLITLNLAVNRIKTLEDHIFDNFTNLKYLNLSFNPIEHFQTDLFAYLENLEHLDLRKTDLWDIQLGLLSFQTKLISLDLSENLMVTFDFGNFLPSLPQLKSLRLADNRLRILYEFRNSIFPRLTLLDLKNNDFECNTLKNYIRNIDWKYIEIPTDPNAIDRKRKNIRGIVCN